MTEALVKIYTSSSDLTEAEVKVLLKANGYRGSWITPEEALEYGLATEIVTGDEEEKDEEKPEENEENTDPEEDPEENPEGEEAGDEENEEDEEGNTRGTRAQGYAKRYYSSARKSFFDEFIKTKTKNSEIVKPAHKKSYAKEKPDEDATFDALCEKILAMLTDAADKKKPAGGAGTQKTVWDAIHIK